MLLLLFSPHPPLYSSPDAALNSHTVRDKHRFPCFAVIFRRGIFYRCGFVGAGLAASSPHKPPLDSPHACASCFHLPTNHCHTSLLDKAIHSTAQGVPGWRGGSKQREERPEEDERSFFLTGCLGTTDLKPTSVQGNYPFCSFAAGSISKMIHSTIGDRGGNGGWLKKQPRYHHRGWFSTRDCSRGGSSHLAHWYNTTQMQSAIAAFLWDRQSNYTIACRGTVQQRWRYRRCIWWSVTENHLQRITTCPVSLSMTGILHDQRA